MKLLGAHSTDLSNFAPQEFEPILIRPLEPATIDILENLDVLSDHWPLVLKSLPLEVRSHSAKDHFEHSALHSTAEVAQ